MKVGFAVQRDEGLESQVYNHFGSAPMFLVVETGAAEVQTIHNQDMNHSHGACRCGSTPWGSRFMLPRPRPSGRISIC